MYKDLEGKTAVVTGSGKRTGIGYAIAEKFASCGAHVVIADLGITSQPGVAGEIRGPRGNGEHCRRPVRKI